MENENENADSTNGEEVDVETLKKQLAEKEEQNKKLFERAKQAEALAKQLKKPEEKETPKNELNLKDIRALQDVHDDDVDQITDYAKFKGVSVAEAKKLPEMQALLRTREEERTTAQATNTGGGRKATSKDTHEAILERAEAGQLPEDDEGIKKLSEARLQVRLDKIKT